MSFALSKAMRILTDPHNEWNAIHKEKMTTNDIFVKYAIILAAVPSVSFFIGYSIIGYRGAHGIYKYEVETGISQAVLIYILSLAGVFVLAFIIDILAPWFGAKRNMTSSTKVAVFSSTASWLGGIFYIVPALSVLILVMHVYSLVLLYMGLKRLKHPPNDNMTGYFIITLVIAAVSFYIIKMVIQPGI